MRICTVRCARRSASYSRQPEEALETDSLDSVLLAVACAKAVFFENYDVDESFGSATFLEILRDLQQELGQKSQYTFEQLESMRTDPSCSIQFYLSRYFVVIL